MHGFFMALLWAALALVIIAGGWMLILRTRWASRSSTPPSAGEDHAADHVAEKPKGRK